MRRAPIAILLLLLLTSCWDRLPLRDLHLIDIAGLDVDEKSGDIMLDYVVTTLKKAGRGQGEPVSETTRLRGPSLVEAVGQGEYVDQGPFLAISTRVYLISETFAARDPVRELSFLLHAPYTSINSPVVVFEGSVSRQLKGQSGADKPFAEKLNNYASLLETNGIMSNVSMMHFLLSREDPLGDLALPLLKPFQSGVALSGALLFRQGSSTGGKLDAEQVRVLRLLSGKGNGKQRITGRLTESGGKGEQAGSGQTGGSEYGFSVKKADAKKTVLSGANGLPKMELRVKLGIYVFNLEDDLRTLKPNTVKRMEQALGDRLNRLASSTIGALQQANCDALGIGKHMKAFHPNLWKSLNWRNDYPRMSIEPKFDVKILNSKGE